MSGLHAKRTKKKETKNISFNETIFFSGTRAMPTMAWAKNEEMKTPYLYL